MLRFVRVKNIMEFMSGRESDVRASYALWRVLKFLFVITVDAHMFACLLYFSAIETEQRNPDTSTWLHNVRGKLNGLPDSAIGRYLVRRERAPAAAAETPLPALLLRRRRIAAAEPGAPGPSPAQHLLEHDDARHRRLRGHQRRRPAGFRHLHDFHDHERVRGRVHRRCAAAGGPPVCLFPFRLGFFPCSPFVARPALTGGSPNTTAPLQPTSRTS